MIFSNIFNTFLLFSLLNFHSVIAQDKQEHIIFGDDDRYYTTDIKDSYIRELSRGVGAMIYNKSLNYNQKLNKYELNEINFQQRHNTCEGVRFNQDMAPSLCSGFLITKKHLVTAAHCMMNSWDCTNNSWVFNFVKDKNTFTQDEVYSCKKVHNIVYDKEKHLDFAVIELDRNTIGTSVLPLTSELEAENGLDIYMLGHPGGLAQVLSTNAQVKQIGENHFRANLDAMGGNSGSPIISKKTGNVIGILVRGGKDPVMKWDEEKQCYRENICTEGQCDPVEAMSLRW